MAALQAIPAHWLRPCRAGAHAMRWALVIAVPACADGAAAEAPTTAEDAAVYRAALAPRPDFENPRRVVLQKTGPPPEFVGDISERLKMHAEQMPGLDRSTIRSYLARHRQVAAVPELGDSTHSWISSEEWDALVERKDGWSDFDRRYPGSGGVTSFSRVGYSHNGAQALVYVNRACPLCGEGEYVLLDRVNGPVEGLGARARLGFVTGRWPACATRACASAAAALQVTDQLAKAGILPPPDGCKPPDVIIDFTQLHAVCGGGVASGNFVCSDSRCD